MVVLVLNQLGLRLALLILLDFFVLLKHAVVVLRHYLLAHPLLAYILRSLALFLIKTSLVLTLSLWLSLVHECSVKPAVLVKGPNMPGSRDCLSVYLRSDYFFLHF